MLHRLRFVLVGISGGVLDAQRLEEDAGKAQVLLDLQSIRCRFRLQKAHFYWCFLSLVTTEVTSHPGCPKFGVRTQPRLEPAAHCIRDRIAAVNLPEKNITGWLSRYYFESLMPVGTPRRLVRAVAVLA